METVLKRFDELTVDELYDILELRVSAFVVEQHCPYPEIDGLDKKCLHMFLREGDRILAYLRIMDRGIESPDYVAIGRVVASERRKGHATRLLREGIAAARREFGDGPIYLEAQVYAKGLYEKAGFRTVSEEFLLDGIPHVKMLLK